MSFTIYMMFKANKTLMEIIMSYLLMILKAVARCNHYELFTRDIKGIRKV
jgi:hypothetical protein